VKECKSASQIGLISIDAALSVSPPLLPPLMLLLAMHVMTLMQTMMAEMMVEVMESGSQQAASVVVWVQSVSQSAMSPRVYRQHRSVTACLACQ